MWGSAASSRAKRLDQSKTVVSGLAGLAILAGAFGTANAENASGLPMKADLWSVADYDFTHPAFDTDWRKSHVLFGEGEVSLRLMPHPEPQPGGNRFAGAAIRQRSPSGYGSYAATIKPARGPGLVTGFFTYSGPYFGTRHDEIDIEFLGKDTRYIHLAWFRDGKLTSRFVPLGFDAAERPRRYRFDWLPDQIRWYVDDKLIFKIEGGPEDLPSVPGRLYANLWAADPALAKWAGLAAPELRGEAVFRDLSFIPLERLDQTTERVAGATTETMESAVRLSP